LGTSLRNLEKGKVIPIRIVREDELENYLKRVAILIRKG
jgi:hypothetical protein